MKSLFSTWSRFSQRLAGHRRTRTIISPQGGLRKFQRAALALQRLEDRLTPANMTWTGGATDTLWSDPANWQSSTAPQPGDTLIFQGTPQSTVNDLPTDTAFGAIQFLSPSDFGNQWNVHGNEVVLGGANAILVAPPPGDFSVVSFNLPIQLSADMTVNPGGAFIALDGAINTAGYQLNIDGGSEVQILGDISGAGGVDVKNGSIILYGNNSYTGETFVEPGANLGMVSPTALGAGPAGVIVSAGATLSVNDSLAKPIELDSGILTTGGTNSIVFSGPIVTHTSTLSGTATISALANATITGLVTIDVGLAIDGNLTFGGGIQEISPGSGVGLSIGGTVVFSGTCTYTGKTFVEPGTTLQVDGTLQTASVQVEGGTLDGTGTINAPVFTSGNGEVAPGEPVGTLTTGDAQINTPFPVTLDGPALGQYSQMKVNGSPSLTNSTLQISLGYTPVPGTSFTIINNDGTDAVSGTFAGLPEGATFTVGSSLFRISYVGGDGNDVTLTAVGQSVSGLVFADVNDDGQVDFGEKAIAGVTVTLTGTDDLGNAVNRVVQTDANGIYAFTNLRPSNAAGFTITETQPAGFLEGKDSLGLVNGTPTGSAAVQDVFTGVVLHAGGSGGENYNFGERPPTTGLNFVGQSAAIGFWQNKNGQNLIQAVNGGASATQLGHWLADTFPNMYASLDGKTNAQVAAYYKTLFARTALTAPAGPPKVDAQVMATALAVYMTNQTLAGTTASAYGFQVSAYGLGDRGITLGGSGTPFGASSTVSISVLDLLLAVNNRSYNGVVFDLNHNGRIDLVEAIDRTIADLVFTAINEAGGL